MNSRILFSENIDEILSNSSEEQFIIGNCNFGIWMQENCIVDICVTPHTERCFNPYKIGTLNNGADVYVDPYMNMNDKNVYIIDKRDASIYLE